MELRAIENSKYVLVAEIRGEEHSFCNFLRKTLLEEESVDFAGYVIEHPLLASPVFTLRTKRRQANVVFREGLEKMLARSEEFRKRFHQAASEHEIE